VAPRGCCVGCRESARGGRSRAALPVAASRITTFSRYCTSRRDAADLSPPRSCVARPWSEFCHVLFEFILANHYAFPMIVTSATTS